MLLMCSRKRKAIIKIIKRMIKEKIVNEKNLPMSSTLSAKGRRDCETILYASSRISVILLIRAVRIK